MPVSRLEARKDRLTFERVDFAMFVWWWWWFGAEELESKISADFKISPDPAPPLARQTARFASHPRPEPSTSYGRTMGTSLQVNFSRRDNTPYFVDNKKITHRSTFAANEPILGFLSREKNKQIQKKYRCVSTRQEDSNRARGTPPTRAAFSLNSFWRRLPVKKERKNVSCMRLTREPKRRII